MAINVSVRSASATPKSCSKNRKNLHSQKTIIISFIHLSIVSVILSSVEGSTSTPLSQWYLSDVSYGNSNDDSEAISLEGIYLITQQKWQAKTALPISLMSARSHHRIRQSSTGLDDAGMDLQGTQLGISAGQETTAVSWTNWKLPFPVIVCAFAGAILFTFLFLLWLRKQMSSEKKSSDGDRRELVEKGAVDTSPSSSSLDKPGKSTQEWSMEAKWVHQPATKPASVSVQTVSPTAKASLPSGLVRNLPEVLTVATPEKRPEPIRIKAKGSLLERRGSSASLTIELAPAPGSPPHVVTPTRECTSEEFLLSAGNILSRTQLRKVIRDPSALHKEFWEVPLNLPEKVDIFGAGVKNRYSGVLPNPHSRVVLRGFDNPVASYINANYIRGYDGENKRYIATQGPLASTVADFWRMVWTEKVSGVVMMTRLFEAAKAKCDVYFPLENNSRIQAGPFTITVTSITNRDGYMVRDIELRHEGERRNVTHYWYDSWPDHAVPQAADSLVSLAAVINTLPGPVVVHCSAGIGRTGCFIALATGMIQLARDGRVDVLGILCQMRYDRGGMIQTAEQYEFVHKALCLFEQTLDGNEPTTGD
ncbi:tyrosine-protein phosphatase non-receptor type 7-like isoform X1 [Microplitis mediator]|uniref:tyrosine-protein phosphatase non-receptor type 7-like isoform X1 n=2 Tax=Microplitis mediator TaxID=375433 RepID=UPI0025544F1B|nr:tyrosine-protein phosphatase non-receptor type 7-like isoform X1 [Microplitis mediator]